MIVELVMTYFYAHFNSRSDKSIIVDICHPTLSDLNLVQVVTLENDVNNQMKSRVNQF